MACNSEHQRGRASGGDEHWSAGNARQVAVPGAFWVRLLAPVLLTPCGKYF
jgi:hypothetical protein